MISYSDSEIFQFLGVQLYVFKISPLKFENQIESPESQNSEPYLYIPLDPQLVDIIDCIITYHLANPTDLREHHYKMDFCEVSE